MGYAKRSNKRNNCRQKAIIRKKEREEKAARKKTMKHKKEREEKAARKKEGEQENASAGRNLDPEDSVVVPDHSTHQHQHDTSDGEAKGGLLLSHEGQVTLPASGNLEMEDAEDSHVSCPQKMTTLSEGITIDKHDVSH
jgi:hypothetical protein